jgi:hypothetical protein
LFSRKHLRSVLPFWIALLVVGSFMPPEAKRAIGTQSGMLLAGPDPRPGWPHRAWHIGSFGLTALLAGLVTLSRRNRLLAGSAIFVLGLMIEVLQSIIFAGYIEWWDVRDDGYATVAMTLLSHSSRVRQILLKASN